MGDNIGSEQWLEAKKKRDDAKKFAEELDRFNKLKLKSKNERQIKHTVSAGNEAAAAGEAKVNAKTDTSVSDFGRNSNFSFASGAFSNNLRGRAKTIKEKQMEYALTSVPKPKQRKE